MDSNGVCPGRTPKKPSAPGISTSSTVSFTSSRSADTICSCRCVGRATLVSPRLSRLTALRLGDDFVYRAHHVEILLRDGVVLSFGDFPEPADRIRDCDVLAFETGELLCDEERLRQEFLNLSCTRHRQLVVL